MFNCDLPAEVHPLFVLTWYNTGGMFYSNCFRCHISEGGGFYVYADCPEALYPFNEEPRFSGMNYTYATEQGTKNLNNFVLLCDNCYKQVLPKYIESRPPLATSPVSYRFTMLTLKPKVNSKSARSVQ